MWPRGGTAGRGRGSYSQYSARGSISKAAVKLQCTQYIASLEPGFDLNFLFRPSMHLGLTISIEMFRRAVCCAGLQGARTQELGLFIHSTLTRCHQLTLHQRQNASNDALSFNLCIICTIADLNEYHFVNMRHAYAWVN